MDAGAPLETARLRLRRFAPDDVDLLVELDADPHVVHFITGGVPTPRQEVVDEVLPVFVTFHREHGGYGYWAAEEQSVFVGWFHLRPGPDRPATEPELGYRLRRDAWGRGLATEGARALIELAFTRLGAQRVVAETMAVHTASRRVMEKAGLSLLRTFTADWPYRIEGDEHGDVEYAVTREQWLAARGPG